MWGSSALVILSITNCLCMNEQWRWSQKSLLKRVKEPSEHHPTLESDFAQCGESSYVSCMRFEDRTLGPILYNRVI